MDQYERKKYQFQEINGKGGSFGPSFKLLLGGGKKSVSNIYQQKEVLKFLWFSAQFNNQKCFSDYFQINTCFQFPYRQCRIFAWQTPCCLLETHHSYTGQFLGHQLLPGHLHLQYLQCSINWLIKMLVQFSVKHYLESWLMHYLEQGFSCYSVRYVDTQLASYSYSTRACDQTTCHSTQQSHCSLYQTIPLTFMATWPITMHSVIVIIRIW